MLDTVKINHVQHISFTQSRLTDAVSVILSELLSYEHPSKWAVRFFCSREARRGNLRASLLSCDIFKAQGKSHSAASVRARWNRIPGSPANTTQPPAGRTAEVSPQAQEAATLAPLAS